MNKSVYLVLLMLDLSKIVVYKFWYDYVKPEHGENAKLCYIDTGSFTDHVKRKNNYKDVGKYIETRFYTSNF